MKKVISLCLLLTVLIPQKANSQELRIPRTQGEELEILSNNVCQGLRNGHDVIIFNDLANYYEQKFNLSTITLTDKISPRSSLMSEMLTDIDEISLKANRVNAEDEALRIIGYSLHEKCPELLP